MINVFYKTMTKRIITHRGHEPSLLKLAPGVVTVAHLYNREIPSSHSTQISSVHCHWKLSNAQNDSTSSGHT